MLPIVTNHRKAHHTSVVDVVIGDFGDRDAVTGSDAIDDSSDDTSLVLEGPVAWQGQSKLAEPDDHNLVV